MDCVCKCLDFSTKILNQHTKDPTNHTLSINAKANTFTIKMALMKLTQNPKNLDKDSKPEYTEKSYESPTLPSYLFILFGGNMYKNFRIPPNINEFIIEDIKTRLVFQL